MADTPKKILVADDSKSFVTYLSLLLRKMGFSKIVTAENGLEALRLLNMWKPDVLLLDINMPEMDGIETLRRLKAEKELSGIPVIMITARKDKRSFDQCKSLGCAGYLVKPVKISALHDLIQESLAISEGNRRFHLRTGFDKKVSIKYDTETHELRAVTLSEGGIFVKTKEPPPVGSEVKVTIPVKGGKPMVLTGDIVHHITTQRSSSIPPGMGIKFRLLTKEESERLGNCVMELITGMAR